MRMVICYKLNVIKTVLKNSTVKIVSSKESRIISFEKDTTLFSAVSGKAIFSVLNDSILVNVYQ